MEQVADPDDYNLRRRLKQLHDAKEAVKSRKDTVLDMERRAKKFSAADRDRFIAEKLVDYIHELRPLLAKAGQEERFLAEEVETADGAVVTIGEIAETRGYISEDGSAGPRADGDGGYLPYRSAMAAWDICNGYFSEVAGAALEPESAGPEQNPVDPAGRFDG